MNKDGKIVCENFIKAKENNEKGNKMKKEKS
jgi:hypothetical protein